MSRVTFDELLEAGAQFGHLTRKWNPKMAPYIFMEQNGIHIIDINKTVKSIDVASNAIKQITKSGRKILFVGTKKQAKEIIVKIIGDIKMPYITERWFGGMLTNFPTIRRAVKKMETIDKMTQEGEFDSISKREKLQISRQKGKLEKNLGSIADMSRIPAAIFVIDINKENIAVREAKKLGIPIFAIVDTNTDPTEIDFAIPANDDAAKTIELILRAMADAIKEGFSERKAMRDEGVEGGAEEGEEKKPERKERTRKKSSEKVLVKEKK